MPPTPTWTKRRWLNALGSARLSLWLLLLAAGLFFVGGAIAGRHYDLFSPLNETPLQRWLATSGIQHLQHTWWLFAQIGVLALLAANTAACLALRIGVLVARRKSHSPRQLLYLSTPSAVHVLFCCAMAGHLVTFTAGRWTRVPAATGRLVEIPGLDAPLRITSITDEPFESPALEGRVRRTTIHLADRQGGIAATAHLAPLRYGGTYLFVDTALRPDRRKRARCDDEVTPAPTGDPMPVAHARAANASSADARGPEARTANAPDPATAATASTAACAEPPLQILLVTDPGLRIIIASLAAIVLLMLGYFATQRHQSKAQAPAPAETPRPEGR